MLSKLLTLFKIMFRGIHHKLYAATQHDSFKDSITWVDRLTDCNKDLVNKLAAKGGNLKDRQLCKYNLIL